VRALAATADPIDTTLEGVDGTGAYWSMPRPNAPTDDDQWMTVRAPADGGALQDLWPDQPPHTGTEGIWSDGAGGWVVATDRFFDDRHFHMAIYALAANGDANLLACSPGAEPIGPQIIFRPAVTADAFYAIVNHFGGAEDTWEIVRVATRVP
jgi:hypothetical protein